MRLGGLLLALALLVAGVCFTAALDEPPVSFAGKPTFYDVTLTAKAYDAAGNVTTSAPVNVRVKVQ